MTTRLEAVQGPEEPRQIPPEEARRGEGQDRRERGASPRDPEEPRRDQAGPDQDRLDRRLAEGDRREADEHAFRVIEGQPWGLLEVAIEQPGPEPGHVEDRGGDD